MVNQKLAISIYQLFDKKLNFLHDFWGRNKPLKVSSQKFCFVLFVVRICLFACLFACVHAFSRWYIILGPYFNPSRSNLNKVVELKISGTLFLRSFKRRFPKRVH